MSKQKSYYKSVVLTNLGVLLWIIGVINIIIFALITKNEILIIVSVFVSFLGLIIFIIDDNLNLFFRRSHVYPTLFYKYDGMGKNLPSFGRVAGFEQNTHLPPPRWKFHEHHPPLPQSAASAHSRWRESSRHRSCNPGCGI